MRAFIIYVSIMSFNAFSASTINVKKDYVFPEEEYRRVVGGALTKCTEKLTESLTKAIAGYRNSPDKLGPTQCNGDFDKDIVDCKVKIGNSDFSHTSQLFYRSAPGTAAGALGYFKLAYWTGKKSVTITSRSFLLLKSKRATNPRLSPLGRVIAINPTYSDLSLVLNDDTIEGPILLNEVTNNNSRYHGDLRALASCLKEEIEK